MTFKTFILLGLALQVGRLVAAENGTTLATPSGFTLGIQGSDYVYREPTVGVKFSGSKLGATASYTKNESSKYPFIRLELRYADSRLKYEGSGTMNDVPDRNAEVRMLFGKDLFAKGGYSLTPYVGLGYRYLYNDPRGRSSTGAVGYRRISNYTYLPVGLNGRFLPGAGWVLAPTAEFDVFLGGRQDSRLSDTGLGLPDISSGQDNGYGYRASVLLERGRIAFGPWMHYWRVRNSDYSEGTWGWYEPKNWTREVGAELRYHF
jgi:hypothetical protein